jgi:hypothetical protein
VGSGKSKIGKLSKELNRMSLAIQEREAKITES